MIEIVGDGGHAKVVRDILRHESSPKGAIIAIGNNALRKAEALTHGGPFGFAIHPKALFSETPSVGEGTVICIGAIIGVNVRIGKHVILNTGCSVDHDCIIEDYAHIAPGAHLCGNVHVGEGALIGVGVGIGPNTEIPAWSLVKAARLEIEPIQGH